MLPKVSKVPIAPSLDGSPKNRVRPANRQNRLERGRMYFPLYTRQPLQGRGVGGFLRKWRGHASDGPVTPGWVWHAFATSYFQNVCSATGSFDYVHVGCVLDLFDCLGTIEIRNI